MSKEQVLVSILRVWMSGEDRYNEFEIRADTFSGSLFGVEITDELRRYLIRALTCIGELYPGSIRLRTTEFDGLQPNASVGQHNLVATIKDANELENLIYSGKIFALEEAG